MGGSFGSIASRRGRARRPALAPSPGPRLETPDLFGVSLIVPAQLPRPAAASTGTRGLCARLLLLALAEAGYRGRVARAAARAPGARRRTLARRWLRGELEAEVTMPVAFACASVGLDTEALADAVRRQQRRHGYRHERTDAASGASTNAQARGRG